MVTSGLASLPLKVFLCHSSGDKPAVRDLYQRLLADGVDPWLDEENLLPGQDWAIEITNAVRSSDVIIVCLSRRSITGPGFYHKEISLALDVAEHQPEGAIFIIPLRLEECDVLPRLRRWQWVDVFKDEGYARLLRSLGARAMVLGRSGLSNDPLLAEPASSHIRRTPLIHREMFIDIGVPQTETGDPGSGSTGSPPFGSTNELGFVFDVNRPFSIAAASIGLGVVGRVALSASVFELAPGMSTERHVRVAWEKVTVSGTDWFIPDQRFLQGGVEPWHWFDVPLVCTFTRGKRYELVFSDFAIVEGAPVQYNNWIFGIPLYDNEGRSRNSPYDVDSLITVVDGSARGARATLLPPALLKLA